MIYFNELEDYSGGFIDFNLGGEIGFDHCFSPDGPIETSTKASLMTFGSGINIGVGYDYYFPPIEQKRFIRSWAVIYMICYYLDTRLPFWLQGQRTEITTIYDLYTVLVTHGPVYAAYDNLTNTSEDHIVLVTGVDISKKLVYTNNPWGVKGVQTFEEFNNGFVWKSPIDDVFHLHAIYIERYF